ncbi:MAG: hypothetical protein WEC75_13545 [Dehalococcoidia bacterium]
MRPYPEEILRALAAGVGAHFAPELRSDYARAQFAFAMMLFTIAQQGADTAVPDLIEENRALRALLAEAREGLAQVDRDDARAGIGVVDALPAAETSLKLTDLRRENDALRDAVGKLAGVIEPAADDASLAPLRGVRERLYAHLRADAQRRVVPILSA